VKRLDQEPHIIGALEVRTESSRTFSARLKTNVVIRRFTSGYLLLAAAAAKTLDEDAHLGPWTFD